MLLKKGCFHVLIFIIALVPCRSDPVEGSRLLEEAFRDYDKRIRPNYGGSSVTVNVSLHVLSISEVDAPSMSYTMSFFIRQMWTDPRLSFNSRRNIDTIMLDASTSERIWTPDTFFVNELLSVDHDVLVKNQFCRISQDGSVLLSRRITLTGFSPMNLNSFPYDSHKLRLDLESYGSQTKDVTYQWSKGEVTLSSPLIVPGFTASGFRASDSSKTTSTGSYSRLTIVIDVRRIPLPYELGIMLPVCIVSILCLCCTSTNQPILGVSATIYLVSVLLIIYGQLVFNVIANRGNNNAYCMSPLQIYMLLSCCFGFVCFAVNLMKIRRCSPNNSSEEPKQSKSRTESTSENCKMEELQSAVATSLEITKSSDGGNNGWRCVTNKWKWKCCSMDNFIVYSLWTILLLWNFIFLAVYRSG